MRYLLVLFFLLLPARGIAADTTQLSGCEDTRDRLQIRLEMAQKLQEIREAQLADVVVRYARMEAELKALKEKLAKLEGEKE
jgi:hypothetical protein